MPQRVRAFCAFGKYHRIEVEDEVTALVEYDHGATGVFIASTGEVPGTNRLEFTGDGGKIVVEDGRLTFWRLQLPKGQFDREYQGGSGMPEYLKVEIPVTGEWTGHAQITRDFVRAILQGTPLLSPGAEGIKALELANAMLLSAWTDSWVELPLDAGLFADELAARKCK